MEIQVEKLRQALQLLEPVISCKPTLESLKYVRLGEGKVLATDLDVAVTISAIGGTGADKGVCLLYHTLTTLLDSVPGHLTATITPDGKTATLTAGRTQATLAALSVEDFPPIPNPTPEHEAAVDGDALVRALTAVLPCAAGKDDTRPVLKAICLTLGENPEAAAADGFRLAWEPIPVKLPGEGNLLIPTGAVRALAHLWKHAPKPPQLNGVADPARLAMAKRLVRLGYSPDWLKVSFGEVSLLTQLVKGTFPNYRNLIPKEGAVSVTFDPGDLTRVIKRMLKMARDGSGIIRLSWGDNELQAEVRVADLGPTITSIPALCQGEGRISFNYLYLLDYLKEKQDLVTLATAGDRAPALFSYHGTPHFVLMPMFVARSLSQ
jgi:DNA polymerase-3 subunit beta